MERQIYTHRNIWNFIFQRKKYRQTIKENLKRAKNNDNKKVIINK